MAPARNLLQRHYDSYGDCFGDTQLEFHQDKAPLISDPMAEAGPRSDKEEEEDEVGTSSKEGDYDTHERWLQLGISVRPSSGSDAPVDSASTSSHGRGGPVELNLFPRRPPTITSMPTMVPFSPPVVSLGLQNLSSIASTSIVPPPMITNYNSFQIACTPESSALLVGFGGDMIRVVSPPPRPQTGVWLDLKAAQHQVKEPFLPQIPKCYLRIKDGRMTVWLLMKYLANKLGLGDEAEVEIKCRGQQLLPFLTLQHIRDSICCSRPPLEMMPSEPRSTDYVMTLEYSRRA